MCRDAEGGLTSLILRPDPKMCCLNPIPEKSCHAARSDIQQVSTLDEVTEENGAVGSEGAPVNSCGALDDDARSSTRFSY